MDVISSNRAVGSMCDVMKANITSAWFRDAQVSGENAKLPTGSIQAGRHCCMIVARKTGTKVSAPFSAGAGQPRRARREEVRVLARALQAVCCLKKEDSEIFFVMVSILSSVKRSNE